MRSDTLSGRSLVETVPASPDRTPPRFAYRFTSRDRSLCGVARSACRGGKHWEACHGGGGRYLEGAQSFEDVVRCSLGRPTRRTWWEHTFEASRPRLTAQAGYSLDVDGHRRSSRASIPAASTDDAPVLSLPHPLVHAFSCRNPRRALPPRVSAWRGCPVAWVTAPTTALRQMEEACSARGAPKPGESRSEGASSAPR